jgi:methylated-DNA-[protein]-cysteine S-methyltransferase
MAMEFLQQTMRDALPEHQPGAFEGFHTQLEEYFSGERETWQVELDLDDATDFFRRAWAACQSIPPGETRTYRWLAEQAGRPSAARGAGQAMARNRVPIVIPCHRVIGSDGGLHGFAGPGLPLKARLLEHEAAGGS